MTDHVTERSYGPKRGLSQGIGEDADSALRAFRPMRWQMSSLSGTDFGVDYVVYMFDPESETATGIFNLQLKGTTQASARLADGVHLSHAFDRTTLNLWHSTICPVVIAIADLIDSREALGATVHYAFVSPYLDEILAGLEPSQKTVTIRVRRADLVHRDLDILPLIEDYLAEHKELRRISSEARRTSGQESLVAGPGIGASRPDTSSSSSFPDATLDVIIQSSRHTEEFSSALRDIRSGEARQSLQTLSSISTTDLHESVSDNAVASYLRAKALSFLGEHDEVPALLQSAAKGLPENDDIRAALAQERLDAIPLGPSGHDLRAQLLDSISNFGGTSSSLIRAKIYALQGDFVQSRTILSKLDSTKANTVGLVVSIVEQSWQRVIDDGTHLLKNGTLRKAEALTVKTLVARAHFQLALGPMEWGEDEAEKLIPPAGLPGMNLDAMRAAFEWSIDAARSAQQMEWPSITDYLLDILFCSSTVLDKLEEALPLFADLGTHSPNSRSFREAATKFALNADKPEIAVRIFELAGTGPMFSGELGLRAAAYARSGRSAKAFELVLSIQDAEEASSETALSALLITGISAHSSARQDVLHKIRDVFCSSPHGRDCLAILDSAVAVSNSSLSKSSALRSLLDYWRTNRTPAVISRHLMMNADPTDKEEAALIVEVAKHYTSTNALGSENWADYGQALITLGHYKEAVDELESAYSLFRDDGRIASLLALSYDLNGDAAKSFAVFDALVDSGDFSETARRYYINAAARFGFLDKAESQIRSALARSDRTRDRLTHLNSLFQVLLMSGRPGHDLWEVAWQYGKLADPTIERQEGLFLQQAMLALQSHKPTQDDSRVDLFQTRRDAFLDQFPKSSYIKRVDVPKELKGSAMMRFLQREVGIDDEVRARSERLERSLDLGSAAVPFSWRPRYVLLRVPDILALWEMRKSMPLERRSWHFDTIAENYPRNIPLISDCVPTISLTSLLVLGELGLLRLAINSFRKVLVSRSTLIALQNARGPLGSGLGFDLVESILQTLRDCIEIVSHPPLPQNGPDTNIPWHREDNLAMENSDSAYLCDDIVETVLVCGPRNDDDLPKPSFSTVDFLAWANQSAELLSEVEVAEKIAMMIRLHIGVEVDLRYLTAAVPEALAHASTMQVANTEYESAVTLQTILLGVWHPEKPLDSLAPHFAGLGAALMKDSEASDSAILTIWLVWLRSVRLNTTHGSSPIRKLSISFVLMSLNLPDEMLSRLWSIYWNAIELGAPDSIESESDLTGVKDVATCLGAMLAGDEPLGSTDISQRLRAALPSDTALSDAYTVALLSAAVEAAKGPPIR